MSHVTQTGPSISIPLLGYAAAIAIVLAVALTSILNLDAAAEDRLNAVRLHEHQVTLAERLRWRNELKVAAGRGFVITADPFFRRKLHQTNESIALLQNDLRWLSIEHVRARRQLSLLLLRPATRRPLRPRKRLRIRDLHGLAVRRGSLNSAVQPAELRVITGFTSMG